MTAQYVTLFFSRCVFAFFLALCIAFSSAFSISSLNYAHASASPPLSPTELAAVIQEIKAMVKTDESLAESFVVREATPERIDRLYSMPEFIQQPKIIRENGLFFAGRGALLKFEKPSDIITKLSAWFPKEYAAGKEKLTYDSTPFPHEIYLYGPYPSWQDEPAAFLTLWNCMPRIAWAQPKQNPFMQRLKMGLPFMAVAAKNSADLDFKHCVNERSGRKPSRNREELEANRKGMRETGSRVTVVLQKKFARFLSSNRCRGTGPDDCVLILLLWSSLSPDDVNLAKALQALESEVAPDGPLPALQKPADQYLPGAKEGEARFDEALRKAAFLRAKLTSIASDPSAWPPQALAAMLDQMSRFRVMFDAALMPGLTYYEFYNNESVSPWQVLSLNVGKTPRVQAAVMAELDKLANTGSCDVIAAWTKDKALRTTFALRRLTDQPPLWCVGPDWNWLKQGASQEARDLRQRYLDSLVQIESGFARENLLSELTAYGKNCFDQEDEPVPPWLRAVCKRWISEPQITPLILKHSRLTLNAAKQFHATPLQLPLAADTAPPNIAAWLTTIVQGMNGEVQQTMQGFIADLKRRKGSVHSATWWSHPRHRKSLVELRLSINNEPRRPVWPYAGSRILFVIDEQTLTVVGVPQRFYDPRDKPVVHVSDLDEDGDLEVWWAESFRTCVGDATDLERGLDCSAKVAEMGEIKGDSLTYFANTPGNNAIAPLRTSALPGISQLALPPTPGLEDQRLCNAVMIGTVLEKKLGINFRRRDHDGEVIDLVCKTYPLYPEQTIVALFHDLKDKQGELAENQKGFVLAVVDVKRRIVHSLYRDTIGEDAAIRIGEYSLQLDTARYNLAPGVRALGVRMNIGYSPRYAEGGENNYLSLFVEEGKQLRPVIKDLPLNIWRVTWGSNSSGTDAEPNTTEHIGLTLTVSDTFTDGWRDLEVVAHYQIDTTDEVAETQVKKPTKMRTLGKLRAKENTYSVDSTWVRSRVWPDQ